MGARPPYCSGLLWCAAPWRGPCAGLVRWCGFARLPRPPRGQAVGDAGARGVQVRLLPPPGRHGPFWGRGDAPSAAGGVEGRRPRAPQAGGECGGRAAVPFSSALGGGPWPPALSPTLSGAPPLGIHGSPGGHGRRARSGRPPAGQCGRGGGERFPRYGLPPRLPQVGIKAGCLVCVPDRAGAAHGVGAEPPAGSRLCGSERAADRGRLTRGCARRGCGVSPLGAAAPLGGCWAAVSLVGPRPPTGWGGGRGGGGEGWGGVPCCPPPAPWRRPPTAAGGRPGGFDPWGPPADRGGRTLPSPPLGPWVPGPGAGPRPGSQLSPQSSRGVGWAGGGGGGAAGAGGGGPGQWSAVSLGSTAENTGRQRRVIRCVRPATSSGLKVLGCHPRQIVRRYPQQGCGLVDLSHNKDTAIEAKCPRNNLYIVQVRQDRIGHSSHYLA